MYDTFSFTTGSGSVAWAHQISGDITGGISAGFLFQDGSTINESSLPLGLGVIAPVKGVTLGASAQGLLAPQPAYHLSAAYHLTPRGVGLLLTGGAIIKGSESRVGAGAEITTGNVLSLRLGYMIPLKETNLQSLSNLTAGLGLSYRNIGLDYAFLPLGDIGQVHRIQLTYRPGGKTGSHATLR